MTDHDPAAASAQPKLMCASPTAPGAGHAIQVREPDRSADAHHMRLHEQVWVSAADGDERDKGLGIVERMRSTGWEDWMRPMFRWRDHERFEVYELRRSA